MAPDLHPRDAVVTGDPGTVTFTLDGEPVSVAADRSTLLDVLRDGLGVRSLKDGCSPQGQCGCCTVLVDGAPRVACVTPARRVDGRSVTTIDGLDPESRSVWSEAFCAAGASQCGFCTPGIILRLHALAEKGTTTDDDGAAVERALLAHLCRCTGWRSISEAFDSVVGRTAPDRGVSGSPERDLLAAATRATIEGRSPQAVSPKVALGQGGFAEDTAPADALVAVPDGDGGWAIGESVAEARRAAEKVQGRRTTVSPVPPLQVPDGDWALTLRTSWTEPAYLETDASWCLPGGEPASPLANGGAFGGKVSSIAPVVARELAGRHGRAVRVVLSREDVVRLGPKRPPIAAGVRADGSGTIRVVRTPGFVERLGSWAPSLQVEEVEHPGPPTSMALRAAGWAEASVLLAAARARPGSIVSPEGAEAEAEVRSDGTIAIKVRCGRPLDEVVLRSYCIGAAHMALGWVTSEALAVDEGTVGDLTIRSFGILRSTEMPAVEVEVVADDADPVNGSDAVFVAVASAVWHHQGYPPEWPTGLGVRP